MLNYPFTFPKTRARLVKRVNRFVVEVDIEGRREKAYLANPGRLWELFLPGTELVLTPARDTGKLPYTVLACYKDDLPVLLHTHLTNRIIRYLIEKSFLLPYENYRVKKAEPAYRRHRFDLLLEHCRSGEEYYLEIKSCTLFNGRLAMFPDAVTTRGANHLYRLKELSDTGVQTGCLFVVMNPRISYFLPAYHIDPDFARASLAVKDDVQLKAVAVGFDKNFTEIESAGEIPIPFNFLSGELADRGVYMLLIKIYQAITLPIGSLGEICFNEGYYVYAGSARSGLSKRINRHMRKNKVQRWHIDYLTAEASKIIPVPVITAENLECQMAGRLQEIADRTVTGFGSSDCRCPGHLFYFAENPLTLDHFIDLIQDYRLRIPAEKLARLFALQQDINI
ncbi:MAG TPA: DNA/RNA nuclease SfsA [Firmicutes bacterium]|nr:DNA/RNA nuclease SfsA [Bacillota bacterium]